jgi:hypothetical protein
MSSVAPPEASPVVQQEWRRRTEAEYRSAALGQHLGLWLIQMGLSPDLLRDAIAVVDDELEHARLSHEVYQAAGGSGIVPLDRSALQLHDAVGQPLEHRVLLATVRVLCLGETVAVPLFRHLRAGCTVPVARATLDRILADEAGHRSLGWDLLDALVERLGVDEVRRVVEPRLAEMVSQLDVGYGRGATARDVGGIGDHERSWGVVPPAEYTPIFEATLASVWRPRFADLGIDIDFDLTADDIDLADDRPQRPR